MFTDPSLAQEPNESQEPPEECACVLPEQSCEICRREARSIYKLEETY